MNSRIFTRRCSTLLLATTILAAEQSPPTPTFRAGTRLVQVEVVVRHKPVRPPGLNASLKYFLDSGPPFGPPGALLKGLTKDDFTLLDEGRPQPISVFRAGASNDATFPLPPGFVSNRQDSSGHALNGATVVLVDFLNAGFEMTDYARDAFKALLHSLSASDNRVAVYTLGQSLHVLQDFTDDPRKLIEASANLDQRHGAVPSALADAMLADALNDFGDLQALEGNEIQARAVHSRMTARALRLIIQHLSGVPGRKNLIWLMEEPRVPPSVMAMMQQANVVLYPVTMRGNGIETEHVTRDLAALTGATAFFDAKDLTFAMRASEEDASDSYVLGFYPSQQQLDGTYHKITVALRNGAADKSVELRYRPGYRATKVEAPVPEPTPAELFQGPLNSARIGLAAHAAPDSAHAGLYDVSVVVDLHDIHLDRKDGGFTGAFDLSVPNPAAAGTVKSATVAIQLTGQQFAGAMEQGFKGVITAIEPQFGEIRVVVRDRATGIAGSLRVPVERQR